MSGRRLDDVKQRTALAGDVYYAGLHGLEIESAREHYLHPGLPRAEAALRALAGPLAAELAAIDGAFLEDKTHALVAHFRASTAEGARQAEDVLLRHAKRDLDAGTLRVMRGASMIELMPNIDWHKGSAVQWILDRVTPLRGPAWPVYIGDDLTDEDGFRAVEDIGLSIAASARADRRRPRGRWPVRGGSAAARDRSSPGLIALARQAAKTTGTGCGISSLS